MHLNSLLTYIISYKKILLYRTRKAQPAKNAYVGLTLPGNAGSWQKECKVQYEFEPMNLYSFNFKVYALIEKKKV